MERLFGTSKTTGKSISYFIYLYLILLIVYYYKMYVINIHTILQWMTIIQFIWPAFLFLCIFMLRYRYGKTDVDSCKYTY